MVVVFGLAEILLPFEIANFPSEKKQELASFNGLTPGGRGFNQAVMAARSGAKVSLISALGKDHNAQIIKDTLKKETVEHDFIYESEKHTDVHIVLNTNEDRRAIRAFGAFNDLNDKHLSDSALKKDGYFLTQTDFQPGVLYELLKKAKSGGMSTIVNLSPRITLSQKKLDLIDILVVNLEEARELAKEIGVAVESDALKLARGFSIQGNLTCIITVGEQGSVVYSPDKKAWTIEALPIGELVDHTGADDAYCGTLAAALSNGLPLARALKRSSVAASLTCKKNGTYKIFPTREEIEGHLNDLPDPLQVKADAG